MINNNRRRALLTALMAYGLMSSQSDKTVHTMNDHTRQDYKKPIPNGCKEYTIDGITVIAISEKSARKKVAKILSQ